jgi:Uma2 family endonuclease
MHPPHVPLPGTVYDPLYPESDGQPMGESDPHTNAVIWLRQALKDFFARHTNVYVASQLMLYYEQGNPAGHRDPDVMVVRGVGRHQRLSFRVWEEGTLPCVVFEIASANTWREDIGPKRELYARLGIAEYSWYLELDTLDDLLAFLEENHGLGLFVAEGEEEYSTIEIFDEDEDD